MVADHPPDVGGAGPLDRLVRRGPRRHRAGPVPQEVDRGDVVRNPRSGTRLKDRRPGVHAHHEPVQRDQQRDRPPPPPGMSSRSRRSGRIPPERSSIRLPASPESRTREAAGGPLPQSLFQASPLPRDVRPPMGYIDRPAAAGVIPHAVRPGTASEGTSDAPVPEGRYRDRRKSTGPNIVIARPGVTSAFR